VHGAEPTAKCRNTNAGENPAITKMYTKKRKRTGSAKVYNAFV
jgi:hypothetical protein